MTTLDVKSLRRTVRLVLLGIWLAAFGYLFSQTRARGVDPRLLVSGERVSVITSDAGYLFQPTVDTFKTALLFFPGSLVETEAYVPMARAAAEAGFLVALVELPLSANWFERGREKAYERGRAHMAFDPGRRWVAGGHSLGGKLALAFSQRDAAAVAGLFLVATTHPREEDLRGLTIPVTKVYGTSDGLASVEEIETYGVNLPPHTRWVPVEGGNHAQFAWYGRQLGDRKAAIPREAQQEALDAALEAMLIAVEQAG